VFLSLQNEKVALAHAPPGRCPRTTTGWEPLQYIIYAYML